MQECCSIKAQLIVCNEEPINVISFLYLVAMGSDGFVKKCCKNDYFIILEFVRNICTYVVPLQCKKKTIILNFLCLLILSSSYIFCSQLSFPSAVGRGGSKTVVSRLPPILGTFFRWRGGSLHCNKTARKRA